MQYAKLKFLVILLLCLNSCSSQPKTDCQNEDYKKSEYCEALAVCSDRKSDYHVGMGVGVGFGSGFGIFPSIGIGVQG